MVKTGWTEEELAVGVFEGDPVALVTEAVGRVRGGPDVFEDLALCVIGEVFLLRTVVVEDGNHGSAMICDGILIIRVPAFEFLG